jgi:capsular polysaccharide biosynthesis protein
VIVPSDEQAELHPFMRALLALAAVPEARLVRYAVLPQSSARTRCPRLAVAELHVVDWESIGAEADRRDTQHLPTRFALVTLRARLAMPGASDSCAIYVSRAGAGDRRVRNDAQVIALYREWLARGGWAVRVWVHGDDPAPPMREAVARFSNARIVLGVHGAGLSNCVFSPVGTHLVEISIGRHPVAICYAHLAAAIGLRYSLVGSASSEPATDSRLPASLHSSRFVRVSLSALKAGLEDCGFGSPATSLQDGH